MHIDEELIERTAICGRTRRRSRTFLFATRFGISPRTLPSLIMAFGLVALPVRSQQLSSIDREREQVMLQTVASDIRKNYYDPKLHALDWDAKVHEAKEKIAKATTLDKATLVIAAVLESLDDSHTNFIPPYDPIQQDYGWEYQMIGTHCYVTHVRPKSDAANKGLKPGDEVLTIDGFTPTREGLNKMEHVFSVLAPQSRLQVDLRDRSGHIRKVEVVAKIRQSKTFTDVGDETGRDTWRLRLESEDQRHRMRPQSKDMGRELMIVKLPFFAFEDIDVHDMMVKARKFSTLIMDLRGNPGGASVTLQDLLGCVFDTDVKIADRVQREATKPILAKSHHNTFNGKLIVLVDSRSASAAELFARVVQIEKRGTVLGQPSSGRVMEAKFYGHKVGSNPAYFYGTSISDADLIMTDGKSLEHAGVTPDETIIPTASDLANGLDPVMARAAELAGTSLSPKQAGELFPYEWPKN